MLTARDRARRIWDTLQMQGLIDGPLKGPAVIDILAAAIVEDRQSSNANTITQNTKPCPKCPYTMMGPICTKCGYVEK